MIEPSMKYKCMYNKSDCIAIVHGLWVPDPLPDTLQTVCPHDTRSCMLCYKSAVLWQMGGY